MRTAVAVASFARQRRGVEERLRSSARVAVVKPADLGQGNDAAELSWLNGPRLGRILREREVRARAVVVAEVAPQPALFTLR